MLTKDQILSANDATITTVNVPEWGGDVCVKTMTGTERDRWEAAAFVDGKLTIENLRARLLACVLCDEGGELLFSPADVTALGGKSAKATTRLFDVAQKLNGLTKDDVDELTKNS